MASSEEITASLAMEDIPIKLRCAACNKLAVNAFRMPCCDQSVCEECQDSLSQACPVCLHEPVNKEDSKPNKALRTTIKVFLKKKGVEREAARKKEMIAKAAVNPVTLATPLAEDKIAHQPSNFVTVLATDSQVDPVGGKQESRDASHLPQHDAITPESGQSRGFTEAQRDIPQMSIESPGPPSTSRRASTQTAGDASLVQDINDEKELSKLQESTKGDLGQRPQGNGTAGQTTLDGSFNFEGMNGGFPNLANMGIGDFSQMMQFMPNGIPNNMMGQFSNMMGMPGMGMDPMAMSQGMYGGFGGPGMGMNGMNMGMGFDAGQSAFGGFSGQSQAFNQNSYGGQSNGVGGNFGTNAGYGGNNMPPHQGNFNQMHQHQNYNNDFQHGYHNQGFQNRGRGRGRGGFFNAGRGRGYPPQAPQAYQGRQANHETTQNHLPQHNARRGSPVYGPMQGSESEQQQQQQQQQQSARPDEPHESEDAVTKQAEQEQLRKELDPGDAEDREEAHDSPVSHEKAKDITESADNEQPPTEQRRGADEVLIEDKPIPIPSILSDEAINEQPSQNDTGQPAMPPPPGPFVPTGPASLAATTPAVADVSSRGRGFGRGIGRGYPDHRPVSRGRGTVPPFDSSSRTQSVQSIEQSAPNPLVIPKGLGVEGAPKGPKALRQGLPNVGIKLVQPQDPGFSIVGRAAVGATAGPSESRKPSSKSPPRSRSRSPARHQQAQHRHHRHRSADFTRDSERERRRDRHERKSRKDDEFYEGTRDVKVIHTRDASSHSSTKRSSRRSHHDHDYDKDASRSKHRSHRSQRDKSRSFDKDRRNSRKRSRTPDLRINGASRTKDTLPDTKSGRHEEKGNEEARASRKRRERDDEGRDPGRKRSRREDDYVAEDQDTGHRSKYSRREEKDSRIIHHRTFKELEKPAEMATEPPKGPKVDQHALEREARNRERQLKEIQRRALMEGKGANTKGKASGRAGERRSSYKYEDEDLTSRVEKERESKRWS